MNPNPPLSFKNRVERNAAGAYYVTTDCTDCGRCYAEAQSVFRHDNIVHKAYVFKQPSSAQEHALAEKFVRECPARSIHDNGGKLSRPKAPSPGKRTA